ncbi:MAG: D-glycero-alpha-D-manno-heptose-1,7-bisphosphate 7-phosphatase [Roseburia sp.]
MNELGVPVIDAQGKKAVFLDRDGVLCEDTDYVTCFEKLKIFPFAAEAVELIHQKGYLAIVVTNQSGVARGMMTEATLQLLNEALQKQTGVDRIYYCPHLPPEAEEFPPYRVICNCRKPGIGMLKRAVKEYGIDLTQSYMVGDRISDIQTGKRAGVKTVYLSGEKKMQVDADEVYASVLEFAKEVL